MFSQQFVSHVRMEPSCQVIWEEREFMYLAKGYSSKSDVRFALQKLAHAIYTDFFFCCKN